MSNKVRCSWPGKDPLYLEYHDKEWGVPVYDDGKIFEFLILEGFQAGLSWLTILKKRENFRKAFDNFNAKKIANYKSKKIQSLLKDAGIIRNRLKIAATISNAEAFLKIQQEFSSFSKYIWSFVKHNPLVFKRRTLANIPAKTKLSDKLSKDLKSRGFKFVGSTIIYAHMQAAGMVNDHLVSCFRYQEIIDSYKR